MGTSKEKVIVLGKRILKFRNEPATVLIILDTNTMASAELLVNDHSSFFAGLSDNPCKESLASFENGCLMDEYIPTTALERQLIRSYYSGKYPWLGKPIYSSLVKVKSSFGSFQVGNHLYPLFLGFPLKLFSIIAN
jgi:hypothetical protein